MNITEGIKKNRQEKRKQIQGRKKTRPTGQEKQNPEDNNIENVFFCPPVSVHTMFLRVQEEIKDIFKAHGEVEEVYIMRDKATGESKGW